MPKQNDPINKPKANASPPSAEQSPVIASVSAFSAPSETSGEATFYLASLFSEFQKQVEKYGQLTMQLAQLEASVDVNEKTLCVIRDHLAMAMEKIDSAVPPQGWTVVLNSVRFVGWRLADACVELLKEHQKMTPKEVVAGLNAGMFRFRTSAPLREIHASLLRHPSVKREDEAWIWTGEGATGSGTEAAETLNGKGAESV